MKGIIAMAVTDLQRDEIGQNFLAESAHYRLTSPLFSALARACAADDDMMELVSEARPGQNKSVLCFCVAHYLLLKSPEPRLAQYFASLTEQPRPATEAFPVFKDFCLSHRAEMKELLAWRTVNTNLVEKVSCLVPALRHIEKLSAEPLSLLELCCSTGLNMMFDEYHYDYGASGRIGAVNSPVQLECKIVGSGCPPIDVMPTVAMRVGVDLVKVDLSDPLEHLWMQAVLCPEWRSEQTRLKAALALRAQRDLRIIQGDVLQVIGPLLEELPGRLCILMSYCRGHWSAGALTELDELVRRASRHRDIHRLDVDPPDTEPPQMARLRLLRLAEAGVSVLKKRSPFRMDHTWYAGTEAQSQLLGEGDIFGQWLDWSALEPDWRSIRSAKSR
jgi:hypothetical protein